MCRLNSLACQQTEVILVNRTTCADLSFATIEGSTNFLFTFPIWQTKVFNLAGIAAPPKRLANSSHEMSLWYPFFFYTRQQIHDV